MCTHVIDIVVSSARACAARVTIVGSVCLCFCVQTRFSNVYWCQKRYNIPNGRCRADNLWEFCYKRFILKLWRYLLT